MRMKVALAVACLIATIAVTAESAASTKKYDLHIPRQSLDTALKDLAHQTGLQIARLGDVTNGAAIVGPVEGALTAGEALEGLLKEQGLTYKVVNEKTIAVMRPGEDAARKVGENAMGAEWLEMRGEDVSLAQASTTDNSEKKAPSAEPQRDMKKLMIEEVVVTAQKRKQSIQDVPLSITALSGKQLTEAGITNALDLSFAVPSMSVVEMQPGDQMIVIRGIGGERGRTALTGIYLDEMPLTNSTAGNTNNIDLRTRDLERVEVLKGPQGTLFGEGSAGGTVRFITNDPKLDRFEGRVAGSSYFTSDGDPSYGFDGVLNIPVVEDVFGLRIVTAYENRGGWIDMVAAEGGPVVRENINDNETREVRVKGLWTPTERLTVKGMAAFHRTDGGGSNLVNVEPIGDSNFQPAFSTDLPIDLESEYELYNLQGTYDLGFAELLSSTSYSDIVTDNKKSQVFTAGPNFLTTLFGLTPPVLMQLRSDGQFGTTAFSQELRLTSAGSGPFKWTVGAFYKDSKSFDLGKGSYGLVGAIPFAVAGGVGRRDVNTSEAWAAFSDASYALTDRLEIGAGVRYFIDDRSIFLASAANVAATLLDERFHKLTYRGFVSYRVTDDVRLYANTSTGFRSGGFNGTANVAAGAPVGYQPETVEAYEVGVKAAFLDGRLRADVALFTSDYVDVQSDSQAAFNGSTTLTQFTQNGGAATVEGIEWAVDWLVTDRWTLSVNGDVTDNEITKLDPSGRAQQVFIGDHLDFVPEYSYSLSSTYAFQWLEGLPGQVRIDYNEQGESTSTFRNGLSLNPVNTAPVVSFLNAELSADWNGWTCGLFGRNLLDEDKSIRPGATDLNTQARPRSVGVTVSKEF